MTAFKELIAKAATGAPLSTEEAAAAFDIMMSGDASPAQMGGFLMALRVRGETVDEIAGGAMALRRRAHTVAAPEGAIDTCGTGGDAAGTFNISTAAAIVTAACGVAVAKHGNRAVSSKSGSADVLSALGINIDAGHEVAQRSLMELGITFLMAPRHHAAMRHVAPVRVELGTRTIFNLLGPLANPAEAKHQLMGVFDRRWIEPLAQVLGRLGSKRVWVVHGRDGLDEITTTAETDVAEFYQGKVRTFVLKPEDVGLPRVPLSALKGGDADTNAAALRSVLAGKPGPYRDITLLNAAAALVVAERAETLADAMKRVADAVDSGRAAQLLERWVALTNAPQPEDA
jgi:anthranilate phosphoribosyltransferase